MQNILISIACRRESEKKHITNRQNPPRPSSQEPLMEETLKSIRQIILAELEGLLSAIAKVLDLTHGRLPEELESILKTWTVPMFDVTDIRDVAKAFDAHENLYSLVRSHVLRFSMTTLQGSGAIRNLHTLLSAIPNQKRSPGWLRIEEVSPKIMKTFKGFESELLEGVECPDCLRAREVSDETLDDTHENRDTHLLTILACIDQI